MVWPLSLLTYKAAYATWIGLTGAGLVEATGLRVGRLAPLIILSPLFLIFLGMGQSGFLVAALAVAALAMPGRPITAGILLGLAACIKPQLLLFVPIGLAVAGRWRTLFSTAWAGLFICALATIVFGPRIWLDWITALPRFIEINRHLGLIGEAPRSLFLRIPLGAVAVFLVWRAFKASNIDVQIMTALGAPFLCSEHVLHYDLVLLLPPALSFVMKGPWRSIPFIVFLTGLVDGWFVVLFLLVYGALLYRDNHSAGMRRSL